MAKRHAEDSVLLEKTVKLSRSSTYKEQGSNEGGSDSWEDSGYCEPREREFRPMDVDNSSSYCDQEESFLSGIRVDEESNPDVTSLEDNRTEPKNRPFSEVVLHCSIRIGQKEKKGNNENGESLTETSEQSPQDCILKSACALLNSGGGVLVIKIDDYKSLLHKESSSSNSVLHYLDEFWKTVQPKLNTLANPSTYDNVFDRRHRYDSDEVLLFINAPKHVCTMEYNLYFAGDADTLGGSYEQVHSLLLQAQAKKMKPSNVDVSLQDLPELPNLFTYHEKLNFHESKQIQLKDYSSKKILKNHKQRDKVCRHISAFANTSGGVIIMGVSDSGEVHGLDLTQSTQEDLEESLNSLINNMHFPVDLQRKVHWDMEFFPVNGFENRAVLVIKIAGMASFGGVFAKSPKSFEVQQGVPVQIEFQQWQQRMLSTADISKAMEELCSKFTKLHFSGGQLLTVKGDVQKIRDSFFTVNDRFLVTPEGFETNLPPEVHRMVQQLQNNCSENRHRGLIAASHSWLANLGGKPLDGVVCDLLVISRNLGGLHLFTICQDESERFLQYSRDVAQKIKESLVRDGDCHEKFYVSYHVVPSSDSSDKVELALLDDRYPPGYDLKSHRDKLNEVLKALVIILARVPSSLSNKLGVKVMNLLTKEQFQLVYQQININKELWVKGVAGTGKTLVATELMRELRRREKLDLDEILCVCENEGIAQQIREAQVCNVVCRQTFMDRSFPKAKHVVMDEVHNYQKPYLQKSWYHKAKEIVRQHDPNNPGYLWFFTDKYQKDHQFRTGMPVAYEQKPEFHLKTVIRNSGKIFRHAKKHVKLAKADETPVLGHDFEGDDVTVIPYSTSKKSQLDVLNKTFEKLFEQGYIPRDIAVLFAKQDCIPSNLTLSVRTCTARDNSSDNVVISTVNKFSGLERPIVILVDVHCSIPYKRYKDPFIYSAETRAMVKLFIIQCEICRRTFPARK